MHSWVNYLLAVKLRDVRKLYHTAAAEGEFSPIFRGKVVEKFLQIPLYKLTKSDIIQT